MTNPDYDDDDLISVTPSAACEQRQTASGRKGERERERGRRALECSPRSKTLWCSSGGANALVLFTATTLKREKKETDQEK